jgi:hypothetical protein
LFSEEKEEKGFVSDEEEEEQEAQGFVCEEEEEEEEKKWPRRFS